MAINYDLSNPKGIGLFDYIIFKGNYLYQKDGQWLSSNDAIVQDLIDEYVPNAPYGWENFVNLMFQDPDFNQVFNTASSVLPILSSSLPASMVTVRAGIYKSFSLIFSQVCDLGGATQTMRNNWATLAQSIGLPNKFINVIKQ